MVRFQFFICLYLIFAFAFIDDIYAVNNKKKNSINKISHYPPKVRYKIKARRIKELENKLNKKIWQWSVKAYECGIIQLPLED